MRKLKPHPLALLVPPSLGISVRTAIEVPVILVDGDVLDGRARVSEAIRLGIPCPFINLSPKHHDEHPAVVLVRAMAARAEPPEPSVRAMVCARLVHAVRMRPEWLDRYDSGFSARVQKHDHLIEFLKAGDAKLRTYQRARKILEDERIVEAVVSGMITLRAAEQLVQKVPASRRLQFIRMTDEQRGAALGHLHKRRDRSHGLDSC
ncbi:hypothetical protein [Paraburkholderia unamae]|uniref:Uncharacterized protein n=1 Tax=Paraburkholderia unamae TaxID=219649 RepID=A0ACC6RQR7_9BURK